MHITKALSLPVPKVVVGLQSCEVQIADPRSLNTITQALPIVVIVELIYMMSISHVYFEHIVRSHCNTCLLVSNLNYKPFNISLKYRVAIKKSEHTLNRDKLKQYMTVMNLLYIVSEKSRPEAFHEALATSLC